jgi:hypothetical protein
MRHLIFHGFKLLLATVFLSAAMNASEAQELRIKKVWYGIYQVKESKEIKDPSSPTGTRYENTGVIAPASNTSDIVLRKEVYFGFGFVADADGEIEEIYLLPDSNGVRRNFPSYTRTRPVRGGSEHFLGWFTGDANTNGNPPGTWTFQLRHRGSVLAEHTFNLTER